MAEIHIGWQIRTGTRGHHGLLEMNRLNRLVTANLKPVLVNKPGPAIDQIHPIARVKLSTQFDLFADHLLGTLQHPREREPARFANIPEHLVGVKSDNLLDRMTKRLRGDGTPVGTVTPNGRLVFNNGHSFIVLCRIHCCPFTGGASANHDHVVMMLSHLYSDYLYKSGKRSCRYSDCRDPIRSAVGFGGIVGQVFRFYRRIRTTPAFFALLGITAADLAGGTDAQRANPATGTADRLAAEDHANRHAQHQQQNNKQY